MTSRFRTALAIWATCALTFGVANSQVPMTGAGKGAPGGGITPSSTTWDSGNKSANITLTNSNLTATVGASGQSAVRATSSLSGTDKRYGELTIDAANAGAGNAVIGFANASFTFSSALIGTTNSFGYRMDGLILFNSGALGVCAVGFPAWNTGDNFSWAQDFGAKLFWARVNGGAWLGNVLGTSDPATGANGCDTSAVTGSLFPAFNSSTNTDAVTAKFSSSSWLFVAPSGYTQVP